MADAPPRPSPTLDELAVDDEATLGDFQSEIGARDIRVASRRERDGICCVAATRGGVLIAQAAARTLRVALSKLLLRVDEHDDAIPRPARVPREAADFRPTEPVRGAA